MADDTLSIGEYLKRTRQSRQLDLGAISQELHIRRDYLEALESDAWDRLPGEVYAIGFLRSYARYLDVDAEALVDYRRRLSQHESGPAPKRSVARAPARDKGRARREKPAASPKMSQSRARKLEKEPPAGGGRVVFGASLVLAALFIAGIILLHHQTKPVGAPSTQPSARPSTPITRSRTHHHHHSSVPPTHSSSAVAVTLVSNNPGAGTLVYHVAGPVQVSLSFTGSCWLELWKNGVGQNLSTGGTTYHAGQVLKVSASSSVKVWVGTRAFNLKVDGQSVTLPDPNHKVFHITFQHS